MKKLSLGILGSTRGTDMMALVSAIKQNQLNATIDMVMSDKRDAMILERAKSFGIQAQFIDPANLSREEYDKILARIFATQRVEMIVLIGYMRILSEVFVNQWRNKIINVHPSLLPDFAGIMGDKVHEAVIRSGKRETGCTVHYVTEEVDAGPILMQKRCMVLPQDTVQSLKARVQELEGAALVDAITSIATELSF
jgi:phosphoribosylglycinamide formyltransferase-1